MGHCRTEGRICVTCHLFINNLQFCDMSSIGGGVRSTESHSSLLCSAIHVMCVSPECTDCIDREIRDGEDCVDDVCQLRTTGFTRSCTP